jgi:hypothetical protein
MKTKESILAFIIMLVMCCFLSCERPTVLAPEKPFIIKFKYPYSTQAPDGYCLYEYYDKNGNVYGFFELPEKYNIGDTIK